MPVVDLNRFSLIRGHTHRPCLRHGRRGRSEGHPDEDWEVFRGQVEILLVSAPNESYRIEQNQAFKLRKREDDLWRIRRWIADPPAAACDGESREVTDSWTG